MAKKRPHESLDMSSADVTANLAANTEHQFESQPQLPPDEPANPLMEEVQTFLNLRDELAKKLAVEIEATEQKLAELKKTAASLFPAPLDEMPEERKIKKPKPKTPKEEKPSSSGQSEHAVAESE